MRRPSFAIAVPLVAGLLALAALPAHAADPSASPAASEALQGDPNTEIWQDEALPPDVPDGRTIDVGFTVWDLARQTLSQFNSVDVRVYPKTGKAKPTEAKTRSDWPGHVRASITVPKGGLGTIALGFPGQECHNDGSCVPIFIPFKWGGVGPPPEAARSLLVTATIHPIVQPVIAGQPFDIDVDIAPNAEWDPTALALPKDVVAVASDLNGVPLATIDLRLVNEGQYTGQMTIDAGGEANVVVGFKGEPSNDMIQRSIQRLRIQGGDLPGATPVASRAPGSPAPTPPPGDGPPIVPIAIGIAIAGLLALGIRRGFADL